MRIVSLVPSITELLHYLGLDAEVVGITKFCVHPENWHRHKTRVGGTKNVHIDIVRALHPTLIIASKEENVKEQVTGLSLFSDILLTDVGHFQDALQMIRTVGIRTGKTDAANQLVFDIQQDFNKLSPYKPVTAAYLIWKTPWMTIGSDTFIHSMMAKAGFQNVFDTQTRYPEITIQQLQEIEPEYVFLSSEPYPFSHQDVADLQRQLPHSEVMLVDGEMFSWYGNRMLYAARYFTELRNRIKPK